MQLPQTIELKGIRVLTTRQLAEAYGTEVKVIQNNFQRNKDRYVAGKHYIYMDRDELRQVKMTHPQIEGELKRASRMHFWTEKGALLHAKSLNTDKAWQVYDYLVDFYFRVKENTSQEVKETMPTPVQEKKKQELPQIDNPIRILKVLLKVAEDRGIKVNSFPFGTVDSMLKDNHIGIRTQVTVEKACYELAWELSHAFIHYDGGDMIKSPLSKDYNEQATRAADMVLKILNVKMSQM